MTVFQRDRSTRSLASSSATAPRALLTALLSSLLAACGGGGGADTPAATANPAPVSARLSGDPLLQYQWHLVNTGQLVRPDRLWRATPGVDINVAPVWQQGLDGHGVTVAVVDDGVEVGHEDLRANIASGLSRNYRRAEGIPRRRSRRCLTVRPWRESSPLPATTWAASALRLPPTLRARTCC